jgi:lactate dehydrogenase-like 2-hydroxyacid dehydrogenase
LEELIQMSNALSIHAPLTEETQELINDDTLAHCRADMMLINTARGRIVSLDAVYRALAEGRLQAYAADVLHPEPPSPRHPLIKAYIKKESWLDGRLLLTPHAAFYAEESRREMRMKAARQMLRAVQGLPLRNCVNAKFLKEPRTPIARMDYQ